MWSFDASSVNEMNASLTLCVDEEFTAIEVGAGGASGHHFLPHLPTQFASALPHHDVGSTHVELAEPHGAFALQHWPPSRTAEVEAGVRARSKAVENRVISLMGQ